MTFFYSVWKWYMRKHINQKVSTLSNSYYTTLVGLTNILACYLTKWAVCLPKIKCSKCIGHIVVGCPNLRWLELVFGQQTCSWQFGTNWFLALQVNVHLPHTGLMNLLIGYLDWWIYGRQQYSRFGHNLKCWLKLVKF